MLLNLHQVSIQIPVYPSNLPCIYGTQYRHRYFYFFSLFSVSQFTWQIWQTNNSIKSNKPNKVMKKVVLESEKEFFITEAWTHGPGHGAAYQCSEPSVIPPSIGIVYLGNTIVFVSTDCLIIFGVTFVFSLIFYLVQSLLEGKTYSYVPMKVSLKRCSECLATTAKLVFKMFHPSLFLIILIPFKQFYNRMKAVGFYGIRTQIFRV